MGTKPLSKKEKKHQEKALRDKEEAKANATAIVAADVTESNPPKKTLRQRKRKLKLIKLKRTKM